MSCASCASVNEAEFTAEMMIHFSGIRNIDRPGVLVFPKVSVCLDCGVSRFTIAEKERALLAADSPTVKAPTRKEVSTNAALRQGIAI